MSNDININYKWFVEVFTLAQCSNIRAFTSVDMDKFSYIGNLIIEDIKKGDDNE